MAQLSFMEVAQGLSSVTPPRKLGKSIFEAREKSRGLFDSDLSSDSQTSEPYRKILNKGGASSKKSPMAMSKRQEQSSSPSAWISMMQAGRQVESLISRQDVLSHIERQNNTLLVNFFIDDSITTQFAPSSPMPSTPVTIPNLVAKFDRECKQMNAAAKTQIAISPALQATVSAQLCTFSLTGHLLRHWLLVRHNCLEQENEIPSTSIYYHSGTDNQSRISSLFADTNIAICDLGGEIKFPLRKLVRNKRRWPVAIPPTSVTEKERRAMSGAGSTLLTIETTAATMLKEVAERSDMWFSQKSLLSLLSSKSFDGDEAVWGQQCIAPPYYLKLYITEENLSQRSVISSESKAREQIENDALLRFGKRFASVYWSVFLHEDCLRRGQWIIHQAQERHRLHRLYHFETQRSQRQTLENREEDSRFETVDNESKIRRLKLHGEWERSQLILLVYHRIQGLREEEDSCLLNILNHERQCRQFFSFCQSEETRLGNHLAALQAELTDGWETRLRELNSAQKAAIEARLTCS